MLKTPNQQVVFREFPNETTLAINISNCPCNCCGCHSNYLATDVGEELTMELIDTLIHAHPYITCIGFMGGDGDPDGVLVLAEYVRIKYPEIHIGWYSGRNIKFDDMPVIFNYVKCGPYMDKYGGLDNINTNQRMYMRVAEDNAWKDITYIFQK